MSIMSEIQNQVSWQILFSQAASLFGVRNITNTQSFNLLLTVFGRGLWPFLRPFLNKKYVSKLWLLALAIYVQNLSISEEWLEKIIEIKMPRIHNNMQISSDDFHKQRFCTMPIRARLADNKRLNQFIRTFNHEISSRFGLVRGQLTLISTWNN
jgi:hypothetical protein